MPEVTNEVYGPGGLVNCKGGAQCSGHPVLEEDAPLYKCLGDNVIERQKAPLLEVPDPVAEAIDARLRAHRLI